MAVVIDKKNAKNIPKILSKKLQKPRKKEI